MTPRQLEGLKALHDVMLEYDMEFCGVRGSEDAEFTVDMYMIDDIPCDELEEVRSIKAWVLSEVIDKHDV